MQRWRLGARAWLRDDDLATLRAVAFSLITHVLSSGSWLSGGAGRVEVGSFLFRRSAGADCSWELSRLLNSMQGRQAARKQRELAETGSGRRGAAGLKD